MRSITVLAQHTDLCTDTMDNPGIHFNLTFEQVQGLANGSFAQIALIEGTVLIVRLASSGAHDHYVRERKPYGRLGRHPYILKYHGGSKVVLSERVIEGLLLQYHRASTLAAVLSHPQLRERPMLSIGRSKLSPRSRLREAGPGQPTTTIDAYKTAFLESCLSAQALQYHRPGLRPHHHLLPLFQSFHPKTRHPLQVRVL
jgi:hypothetical protein